VNSDSQRYYLNSYWLAIKHESKVDDCEAEWVNGSNLCLEPQADRDFPYRHAYLTPWSAGCWIDSPESVAGAPRLHPHDLHVAQVVASSTLNAEKAAVLIGGQENTPPKPGGRSQKHALICLDISLCDDQVRLEIDQNPENPIHEVLQEGNVHRVQMNRTLDARAAVEYKRRQSFDRGPRPYFADLANPPVYDLGNRIEGLELYKMEPGTRPFQSSTYLRSSNVAIPGGFQMP